MASFTSRFGFSFYGGRTPGSLTDDGAKFTLDDPQVLDKVLSAFETHTHSGGDRLADPADPPTAALITMGGALPADRTYYYSVSFIDQFGLETRAGEEVAVQTPQSVQPPAGPGVDAVPAGSLTPGLYYYALTIVTSEDETQLSDPTMVGVTDGEGTVILTLPILPEDGDQFRVWRQGPGESGFTKIGLTADLTFVDDGSVPADACACDPANLPPADNTTNSTNAVTITLADMDVVAIESPDRPVKAWRLYRTDVSGNYSADSLVQEVVTRQDPADDTSPLVTSWTDVGDPTIAGHPRTYSQTLTPSKPHLLPVVTELPDPADYAEGYPLVLDDVLYVRLEAQWKAMGGSGGGGGGTGGVTVTPASPWPDFIMTGADGRRWRQTVDADGQLVLVETQLPAAPVPPSNLQVS